MVSRFETRLETPLEGDIDLDEVLSTVPLEYSVKGMFFARYVTEMNDEAWATLARSLQAPALGRQYHVFESYPMRDYIRVFDHAARAHFPGPSRQAFRVQARTEVEVFAATALGKATFALVRNSAAALLRYPDVFKLVARAAEMRAHRPAPRRVVIEYPRFAGSIEQGIGLVEGLVLAFGDTPFVHVSVGDDRRVVYDVRW